jgi:hypothetical protein
MLGRTRGQLRGNAWIANRVCDRAKPGLECGLRYYPSMTPITSRRCSRLFRTPSLLDPLRHRSRRDLTDLSQWMLFTSHHLAAGHQDNEDRASLL